VHAVTSRAADADDDHGCAEIPVTAFNAVLPEVPGYKLLDAALKPAYRAKLLRWVQSQKRNRLKKMQGAGSAGKTKPSSTSPPKPKIKKKKKDRKYQHIRSVTSPGAFFEFIPISYTNIFLLCRAACFPSLDLFILILSL
jgi:hypothetical protein